MKKIINNLTAAEMIAAALFAISAVCYVFPMFCR